MKSHLRWNKYILFLILTVILVPFLFFAGGPKHHSLRSIKHLWNLGHILYFAILPLGIFACIDREKQKPLHQICIAFGLAAILGTVMEIFQAEFGRTFDVYDLMRNMIGALLGISFLYPTRSVIPTTVKLAAVAVVASQLYPVAIALTDEYQARRDFPILSDFETPFQIHRWQGDAIISVAKNIGSNGNGALKADLTTTLHSGVAMKYFPPDWHQYQRFQFRVFNPSPSPIFLTCRIHDEQHTRGIQFYADRFSTLYEITTGWNTISIDLSEVRLAPKMRQMDLTRIWGIGIFATRLHLPRTIYIDDVKLN